MLNNGAPDGYHDAFNSRRAIAALQGPVLPPPVEPLHNAVDTQAGFRIVNLAYAEQRPGDCAYYINGNGHQVPSLCGNSKTDAPPPRATAICRDGSYSFSEHPYAGGTCSHHGGVESHLNR